MTLVFLRRVPSASRLPHPIRAPVALGVLAASIEFDIERCLTWGGQKRKTISSLAQGVTPKPWTGSGCPPLPRAPRRPEQLSKMASGAGRVEAGLIRDFVPLTSLFSQGD